MIVAGFFNDHAVLFALICAAVAIAYGIALTVWLLGRPAGSERMQEIARAVQEGAAAYLRRQYTTIAAVSTRIRRRSGQYGSAALTCVVSGPS